MTGKTHAIIGANMVWILALFYGFSIHPVLLPLAAFASLLPDLDAPESKAKHLELGYGRGRNRLGIKPFFLLSMIINAFSRHRGFFHSLFATFLFTLLAIGAVQFIHLRWMPLDDSYWQALTLGYLSHLLADSFTKSGVPYFWPWKRYIGLLPKPFRLRTGGWGEQFVLIFFLGTLLLLTFRLFDGVSLELVS